MIQRAWRSASQLRDLLEDLPAGAYTCDLQGLITYFNRSAIQVWGRTPKLNDFADRFCGSYKLFAINGAPIAHDQCWMALAIKNRRAYNGRDIVVERPNGTRVNVLAHAYPLLNDTGDFFGAVNVLVDVGERRATENASEQPDRATTRFLANLARHQRNPFSPVRQALEILQLKSSSNRQVRWALEVLDRQSQLLKELLEDLLNLARITKDQSFLIAITHIAEMYGGTISAQSEAPYNESEFLISLPAIHEPPRLLHQPNTESRSLASDLLLRIFVMASDGDSPNGLSTLLRLLGNDVRTTDRKTAVVVDVEGFSQTWSLWT